MSDPSAYPPDAERERAAAALAALRAAVSQRQAALAAAGGGRDELAGRLSDLRRSEFVQDPVPVSPRPGLGQLIVFVRKAVYHLFFKWHARSVLQQQNEFNQSAATLIATLAERDHETRRELERLRARVEAIESALEPSADTSTPGSTP